MGLYRDVGLDYYDDGYYPNLSMNSKRNVSELEVEQSEEEDEAAVVVDPVKALDVLPPPDKNGTAAPVEAAKQQEEAQIKAKKKKIKKFKNMNIFTPNFDIPSMFSGTAAYDF